MSPMWGASHRRGSVCLRVALLFFFTALTAGSVRRPAPATAQQPGQHSGTVTCVAFSADGRFIASGSVDHSVKVWNVATHTEVVSIATPFGSSAVAFSPDLALLASANGFSVSLYETSTWQQVGDLNTGPTALQGIAFSPNGRLLASIDERGATLLWDVPARTQRATLDAGSDGHPRNAAVAFSPDGSLVAYVSGFSPIHLWNVAAGREQGVLAGTNNDVYTLAFSADGRTLVSGDAGDSVEVWDVSSRTVMQLQTASASAVAISPDGRLIAVAGVGDNNIAIWDIGSRAQVASLTGHEAWPDALAFSPDGRLLVSGADDATVRLWEMATRSQIARLGRVLVPVEALAFSPDGQTIAAQNRGGYVHLYDVTTLSETAVLRVRSSAYTLHGVAFSPDGRLVASGGLIWDAATGQQYASFERSSEGDDGAAFSPDGRWFAGGTNDHGALLWDVASRRVLRPLPADAGVSALTFSPDSSILAGGFGVSPNTGHPAIVLWDVTSGAQLRTLMLGEDYQSRVSMAFSPDGRRFVAAAFGTPAVFDVATWQQVATVPASLSLAVAYSPDGRFIATVGLGGLLRLWDTQTYQLASAIPLPSSATAWAVAFSPDGRTLAVGQDDGVIQLYDVPQ